MLRSGAARSVSKHGSKRLTDLTSSALLPASDGVIQASCPLLPHGIDGNTGLALLGFTRDAMIAALLGAGPVGGCVFWWRFNWSMWCGGC